MKNEYPEAVEKLRTEIKSAREHLASGGRPSEIANRLHAQGVGSIKLFIVFHEATGASVGDLKAFCRWWGPQGGVTDESAFDAWAAKVLSRSSV